MANTKNTFRNARTKGKPTPGLKDVIVGQHDRGAFFLPAMGAAALLGYAPYYQDSLNGYIVAEWSETKENSGTIAQSADGLLFTTGGADGNSCNTQLIRSLTTSANTKRVAAYFRFQTADVTNTGIVLGLHNTDTDYYSTEPTHQAVLFKDKGAATCVGRTKDGTTGSNTATLATLVNDTDYDVSIVYDGYNSAVFFGIKLASAVWKNSDFVKKTTNLPAAVLRLTMNIENNEGAANTMLVKRFAYAAEL